MQPSCPYPGCGQVLPSEETEEILEGCDGRCQEEACAGGKVFNEGDYGGA